MLQGKTIFILSLMKFDGPASTNFTIAKYLAKQNEVYYIEHPFTFSDYFNINKKGAEFERRKQGFKFFSNGLLKNKIDGVNIIISYPIFPINFLPHGFLYNELLKLNEVIAANRIKRIVKQKKIEDFIFINAYDFRFPNFIKQLNPLLSVYYCVDPIVGPYDRKHGVDAEKIILQKSEVVICTSRALYNEKKKLNPNTYFVPNGADIVADAHTLENISVHKALAKISKPIVGYIGAIERRIDYVLLKELVKILPDVNFVFVGPTYKEHIPAWVFNHANIYLIDPIPYHEIPSMIKGFDICSIPFKKDDISNTIFPLKLFEYLGVGKPVVTTNFNDDLKEFTKDLVHYTSDSQSFKDAIIYSLKNNSDDMITKRIALAKQNTWQDRSDRVSNIIFENLPKE